MFGSSFEIINMEPLLETTVGECLERTAAQFPDNPAIEHRGEIWTYRQLDRDSNHIAVKLLDRGISKGDHVSIWADNSPNVVIFLYALQKIGAIAVMIGAKLHYKEIIDRLVSSDSCFLAIGDIKTEDDPVLIISELSKTASLKKIFNIGKQNSTDQMVEDVFMAQAEDEALSSRHRDLPSVLPQDPSMILFTSGTTSRPKAVLSTHFARVNNAIIQARDLHATHEDKFCVVLPIDHCFCLSANIMAAMTVGACLCFPENRRTENVLKSIQTERCTILNAVPTQFHSIISCEASKKFDVSSLRTGLIGGAFYSPELFKSISAILGITLLSSLGMTESTGGFTVTLMEDDEDVRSSTVGHFMDWIEGKVVDIASGKILPPGHVGEICVKGYSVMQGYYKQADQTAEILDQDGWLHTGDMGFIDSEGNVRLTGRKKELIIRGGENISPAEVESALLRNALIADACVLGVPDDHYGEVPFAFVVLKPGNSADDGKIREQLTKQVANYKVPRHILFLKGFPLSETGKINRHALKTMALQFLETESRLQQDL